METLVPSEDLSFCISRLEAQNRVLRRTGAFLFLLCFFAIGFIGWRVKRLSNQVPERVPNIISAHQFDLLDRRGQLQGMLAYSDDGPIFELWGPDGKGGLSFMPVKGVADHPGFNLELSSTSGKQQITLAVEGSQLQWLPPNSWTKMIGVPEPTLS